MGKDLRERVQLGNGVGPYNTSLLACIIKDEIVVCHACRVRLGRFCTLTCPPHLERDDRFCHLLRCFEKFSAVVDVFQVHADDLGAVIRIEVLEHIRFINIRLVADADDLVGLDDIRRK